MILQAFPLWHILRSPHTKRSVGARFLLCVSGKLVEKITFFHIFSTGVENLVENLLLGVENQISFLSSLISDRNTGSSKSLVSISR